MKRILKFAAFTCLLCGVLFYVSAAIVVRPLYRQVSTHNHLLNVGYACSQYVTQEREFPRSVIDLYEGPRTRSVYLLKGDETDRWGHSIEIVPIDGSGTSGFVISYGRDGIAGGEGFDEDTSVRFAGITP